MKLIMTCGTTDLAYWRICDIRVVPIFVWVFCWQVSLLVGGPILPVSFPNVKTCSMHALVSHIAQWSAPGTMRVGCLCTRNIQVLPSGTSCQCRGTCTVHFLCWSHCSSAILPCWCPLFSLTLHAHILLGCPLLQFVCGCSHHFAVCNRQGDLHMWFFPCAYYLGNFVVSLHKCCICSLLSCFIVSLCHAAKILTKCSLPGFSGRWVVH